jgi:exopolysaccharide biosynthesis polyprenyl glycosylphosphotransferase
MSQIIKSKNILHQQAVDTHMEQAGINTGATGPITRFISKRRSRRHHWRVIESIFMVILDAVLLFFAFYLAHTIRYGWLKNNDFIEDLAGGTQDQRFLLYLPLGVIFTIVLILIFTLRGLYKLRLTGNWFRQIWLIISSSTVGMALLMTYYFFFQYSNPLGLRSRSLVPIFWVTAILILTIARFIVSEAMSLLYRLGHGETRLLVVGSGRLSKMIMQHIAAMPELGYKIVGFLHDLSEPLGDFGRFKMLGTIEEIEQVVRTMQVDEVIIALPACMNEYAVHTVKLCEHLGASLKLVPDLFELSLSRIDMETIEGIPLLGIKQASLNTFQRLVTRLIDITIAGTILVIGSPLWLLLAAIVKWSSSGPAIFKQPRVGLNGNIFYCYKFRSMFKDADQRLAQLLHKNEAQGPLFKMKEDPRITPIGKFLRRTSLDEIPQLLNILKGDMSLVGPRPAVPREVVQYAEWQKGRLAIKPGLTGLWQVRGRSDLSFDEGVLMDLYYIENWSLRLYLQILLRTIPAVLFSRGAY